MKSVISRGVDERADQPRLAVAVLSLRCEPWLAEAVESVISQEPRPEVVVVNSGGGDPRGALAARGIEVPVVEHAERLMPGAARNRGVAATSAPFVAFLAADCLAQPGWVAGRLDAHARGAEAVGSVLVNAYPESRSAAAAALLLHHRRMAHAPPQHRLPNFGLSFDRALLERVGKFREDLRTGEDDEICSRILAAGGRIRLHPGVRTAHRNPRRPRALMRDQYWRGVRSARARTSLGQHPKPLRVAALKDAVRALHYTNRCTDPKERRHLRRGWPLVIPAAMAYSAGTTAAIWSDGR